MTTDQPNIDSVVKKGAPSWEAHDLVLDAIEDERLNDPVPDEHVINFAVADQLQPVLVRANGKGLEVVEGRQRVKRALVINHLAGRHAYRGSLSSVKEAIERLKGTDAGKRIVEECPKGIKVLVTVHRGTDKEAQRAAVAANEHRTDDPLDRKIRKAKRLAAQGFDVADIALDMGRSEQTVARWLKAGDGARVKKARTGVRRPGAKKVRAAFEAAPAGTGAHFVLGWALGEITWELLMEKVPELGKG